MPLRLPEPLAAQGELDQERRNTILATAGAASPVERPRVDGLGFSFTCRDADPERARRDLVLVIETLAARPGPAAALEAATARLKGGGDWSASAGRQTLRAARDEADSELAGPVEGGAG